MSGKRTVKGQYGYIKKQRGKVIFRTIFMFGLSLAIFGIGLWSTGKKANLLTVVAILGCLPASKSAVNMIMFLRAKGCSEQAKNAVSPCAKGLTELYDLVFTSYEKNYQVSHIVVAGNVICGYTEDAGCDEKACGKHVETLLKQGGCKGITVKIFHDLEKYCEGLENLRKQQPFGEQPLEKETQEDGSGDGQLEDILMNLLAIAL